MFKSDILFTGYYGQKNTGDDAFIEVSSWGAKKYWLKNEVKYLARKDKLPISNTENYKGYPFSIPKTYRLQSSLLLSKTDFLISAGGSTIHSKLPVNNIKAKAMQMKSNNKNLKIGAVGVSIGPFKTLEDEQAVEKYLQSIDFLAVRDQSSYDFASSLNLPYSPINSFDLAALLPYIYQSNTAEKDKKKTIGISVCPVESVNDTKNLKREEKRNSMLVDLLKTLDREDDIHFKFVVFNGHERIGDRELTYQTAAKASLKSYEVIDYKQRTELMWNEIATCDFVITTRLHAAIFSCFSDVPFMLNEYHQKCPDFLETIGYCPEYRLYNSEYSIKEKADQILKIINTKMYQPPVHVEKMKDRALLNFTGIEL